jgi:hypothetical protein
MNIVPRASFEVALHHCEACTVGRLRHAAIDLADITAAIVREGDFMRFRKVQGWVRESHD